MRPGHYWGCELGDAGKLLKDPSREGSAILAGPFKSRESWPPNEGEAGWNVEASESTAARDQASLRCG